MMVAKWNEEERKWTGERTMQEQQAEQQVISATPFRDKTCMKLRERLHRLEDMQRRASLIDELKNRLGDLEREEEMVVDLLGALGKLERESAVVSRAMPVPEGKSLAEIGAEIKKRKTGNGKGKRNGNGNGKAKRNMSPEARERIAAAQRKRWAELRKKNEKKRGKK